MDPQKYQKILRYLQKDKIPYSLKTEQERKKFRNYCKAFEEVERRLFKKNKFRLDRKIILKSEVEALLYLYHNNLIVGHLGTNKMYKKLSRSYFWPKMYQEVQNYTQTCDKD